MQNSYYVETFGFKLKVGIKNEISITERERESERAKLHRKCFLQFDLQVFTGYSFF